MCSDSGPKLRRLRIRLPLHSAWITCQRNCRWVSSSDVVGETQACSFLGMVFGEKRSRLMQKQGGWISSNYLPDFRLSQGPKRFVTVSDQQVSGSGAAIECYANAQKDSWGPALPRGWSLFPVLLFPSRISAAFVFVSLLFAGAVLTNHWNLERCWLEPPDRENVFESLRPSGARLIHSLGLRTETFNESQTPILQTHEDFHNQNAEN